VCNTTELNGKGYTFNHVAFCEITRKLFPNFTLLDYASRNLI